MTSSTDGAQVIQVARVDSSAYSDPTFCSHPAQPKSPNLRQVANISTQISRKTSSEFSDRLKNSKEISSKMFSGRKGKLKRKATGDPSITNTTKKQKLMTEPQIVSDESFRTAQTPHFGVIQPISILMAPVPLSNVELWRMRGWRWSEAKERLSTVQQLYESESPKGTNNVWRL